MPWPNFHRRSITGPGLLIHSGYSSKDFGYSWGPLGRDTGMHGLLILVRGRGTYRDGAGRDEIVVAGDAFLLFPGLRHDFGLLTGAGIWEEAFLDIDTPLMGLLERQGVLDRGRPIVRQPGAAALGPVRTLIDDIATGRLHEAPEVLWRLHGGLLALSRWQRDVASDSALDVARAVLESDLARPMDPRRAAKASGLGWELFRKRFRQRYGHPPSRYRMLRRCEAAMARLLETGSVVETVATDLGFCDGAHLRRSCRSTLGLTPEAFRHLHGFGG